jgi:hypothetical protein
LLQWDHAGRTGDEEEYDFKLSSKLIHPTALMLNHPEATITNQANKEYLAVEVLLRVADR